MPYALLYVSRSGLEFPEGWVEVDDIVAVALRANAEHGITGALISTPRYFAQYLEGPRPAVEQLMKNIALDRRHREVTTVREGDCDQRFPNWAMAYSGYATYVDARIEPLFAPTQKHEREQRALALIRLMREFVADAGPDGANGRGPH